MLGFPTVFAEGKIRDEYDIDDIRQLSGYARDAKVLEKLKLEKDVIADCLIIYPHENGSDSISLDGYNKKENEIPGFIQFYKMGISLPV